jgi:hypothetical protein
MRVRIFLLALSFIIILAGQISAQGYPLNMRVEKLQEYWPEDVIKAGKQFQINVYFENVNDDCLTGFYFSPEFYGNDGVTEATQIPVDYGNPYFTNVGIHNGLDTWWPLGVFTDTASWDGYLPDTFFLTGLSLYCAWPPGQGELLCFSFHFQIDEVGTFSMADAFDYYLWDMDPLYEFMYSYSWPVVDTAICGDVSGDGAVNILDVLFIIWCVYTNPDPGYECNPEEWDFNGNGVADILDIIYLIAYLYQGGPEPICNWME